MLVRKHIFWPRAHGSLFTALVLGAAFVWTPGSPLPAEKGAWPSPYDCNDRRRVAADPFFIVEGHSVWSLSLGGRREDVQRRMRADVVRRTPKGEVHQFRSLPFEGAVAFRGTYIDSITVVLLKEELRTDKEDVFYYSCLGFYYPDMLKAASPQIYIQKKYKGLRSFQAGPWIFYPRIGIGFYIKNNRLSGFRIFKPVKPEAFRYWEFYSEKLM